MPTGVGVAIRFYTVWRPGNAQHPQPQPPQEQPSPPSEPQEQFPARQLQIPGDVRVARLEIMGAFIADQGARVVAELVEAVAHIVEQGGRAEAFAMDVADKLSIATVCKTILERYPKIDILVNNAGITRDQLFLLMKDEDWEQVLFTNLFSAFYLTKAVARSMVSNRWGRIINMSSVSGISGNAGQANYSSAKAGLIGFTKSLAKELAGRSVTVNAIAPGFIDTNMTQSLDTQIVEKAKSVIPMKRLGKPDDVANLAVFLASEQSGYITGQVINVDGGLVM